MRRRWIRPRSARLDRPDINANRVIDHAMDNLMWRTRWLAQACRQMEAAVSERVQVRKAGA